MRDGRSGQHASNGWQMAATAAKRPPLGSIAHSHHMAGDARASLDLRGVLLDEANSTLPEIPFRNTRGVRRHWNKFIVILLRSR